MRSTLFLIPHEVAGIPVFGFGWLLIAWFVVGGAVLGALFRRQGWSKETANYVPFLAIVAALIVLASRLEITDAQGQPLGIPVRGFGVMMALAIVAAAGLALHRARRMGLDPDTIYSLAMWMIIPGLMGARLFYIVQYWDEFRQPTLGQTLLAAINVTSGGLVVYGSVIGGLPFGIYYLVSRGLPVMAIGDLIAPSMMVGLALGRVGCFLNGCCYGGLCEGPLGVSFPPGSPPHVRHQARGWLYGLRLAADERGVVIERVMPGSAADEAGVRAGEHVATIRNEPVASLDDATRLLAATGQEFSLTTHEGKSYAIVARAWPLRSLPVHPTQLYAALDAALLAAFLWFYYPFRTRDGEVIAILFTLHPVSRFLIEMIRDDEPGQFGTTLTISQWLSLAFLLAAAALWCYVLRQPRGSGLPHAAVAADRDGW